MESGSAEKILVRGVNWLGDAVMTSPALQRLREARPGAWICLLTPEKLAELWQGQPYLDEVMTFSKEESVSSVGRRLREKGFTTAIAFPNSIRSALEIWLGHIPVRIGYGRPLRSLFLSQAMVLPPGAMKMRKKSEAEVKKLIATNAVPEVIPATAHHARHYLHLVTALGASAEPLAPLLVVGEAAVEGVRARFGIDDELERPWFGLNPGAEYGAAKRWPAEYFIAAANELTKLTNCRWLIFGAAADRALTESIAQGIQGTSVVNLAGQTSLRELAAALKLCRVVISNDTGPMHVAAALGTPVVVPFGSTSPEMTGPFLGANATILRHPVSCAPCFLRECPVDFRCLKGVEVKAVADGVMEIYQRVEGTL